MLSSWRLYSWMRLICTSNSAAGSTLDAAAARRSAAPARSLLARSHWPRSASWKPASSASGSSAAQRARDRRGPAGPDRVDEQVASGRDWPDAASARKVMPLVLLMMRSGKSACRSRNTVLLHQLGVQRRDAVDLVRAEEGEVAHAHAPARRSRRSARRRDRSRRRRPARSRAARRRCSAVDQVDDLHVARQQPLEQRHRPASPAPRAAACGWCS